MATRNLILWTLFSLSASASLVERPLGKCCPPGEIFSGLSKVVCAPAFRLATELYRLDHGDDVQQDGFPRCEEPEDISTTPLTDLNDDDFVQEPACLEILQTSEESLPIVVHCRSNKDRDEKKRAPRTSLLDPFHVRRCCPKNQFFDRRIKSCVSIFETVHDANYSEINLFTSLLPKELKTVGFLKITRDSSKCSEAIFDYEVSPEDVVFENGSLKVLLPSLVDNTREKILTNSENTCFELTPESARKRSLLVRTCRSSKFCQGGSCLRKCCSEDEFYIFSNGCSQRTPKNPLVFHEAILNTTRGTSPNFKDYGLLFGLLCQFGMYPLLPEDEWSLSPEGHLRVPGYDTYEHQQYCMEVLYNNSNYEEALYPLVCFPDPEAKFKVTTILEAISCFFLLLTLLVYSFLPVLQNLHGKTLMCHSASLLVAYVCLAIVPWVTPDIFYRESDEEPSATIFCSSLGYVMLLALLSAFFWLNIMCFDIWRTFGLASMLGESFSNLMFVQTLGLIVSLCVVVYQLLTASGSGQDMNTVHFIIYSCAVTLLAFCYCFLGECLINESNEIQVACYFSNWYEAPKVARSLMFCIARSQKPSYLTAGKFYVFSLETFAVIMKASMAYLSVLRTMTGLRGTTTRGRTHRKRFLLYCLYAWGVPMLMTILGILSDQMQVLPQNLRPNIGQESCWFTQLPQHYGELVFFIGPITIQLASNVVFFVLTSMHCSKVKAEIRRVADPSDPRSKRFHADKTKLIMNIKLFVVMGISWVAEIISSFLKKYTANSSWQEELFYATDALNCLQGLLIFVLFVVKIRVYVALKRRLGFDRKKKVASQATTALHDPYRVKKSASSTTLTSTFAISMSP